MSPQSTFVAQSKVLVQGIAFGCLAITTAISAGCGRSQPSAAQAQKLAAERKQWEENNIPKLLEFRKRIACLIETDKLPKVGRRKFAEPFFLVEDESTPTEQRLMKEPNEVVFNAKVLQALEFSQAKTIVFFKHTCDTTSGNYVGPLGDSRGKPVRSKISARFYDVADPCRIRRVEAVGEPPNTSIGSADFGGKTIIDGVEEEGSSNASQLMGKMLRHVLGKPGDVDFEPKGAPKAVPGGTYSGAGSLGISDDGKTLYVVRNSLGLPSFSGYAAAPCWNLREPIPEKRRSGLLAAEFPLAAGGSEMMLVKPDLLDKFRRAIEGIESKVKFDNIWLLTTSPKGDLVALARPTGLIHIRSFPDATPLGALELGDFSVLALVFNSDGSKLATLMAKVTITTAGTPPAPQKSTAKCEYWVSVWDWKSGKAESHVSWPSPLPMACPSLFIVPDGAQIVGATLDGVRVWSFPELKPIGSLEGVSPATVSRDGKLLAAVSAAGAWGQLSPKDFFLAGAFDTEPLKRLPTENSIRVWSLPDLKQFREFEPCEFGPTIAVLFSPDAKELYSAHLGRGTCVWDVATGKRKY